MTDLCTAVPQLRTPAAIEEKKPPPPPDDAARSWSLDPIAGDLHGQREALPRRGVGEGDMLGFGTAHCLEVVVEERS